MNLQHFLFRGDTADHCNTAWKCSKGDRLVWTKNCAPGFDFQGLGKLSLTINDGCSRWEGHEKNASRVVWESSSKLDCCWAAAAAAAKVTQAWLMLFIWHLVATRQDLCVDLLAPAWPGTQTTVCQIELADTLLQKNVACEVGLDDFGLKWNPGFFLWKSNYVFWG